MPDIAKLKQSQVLLKAIDIQIIQLAKKPTSNPISWEIISGYYDQDHAFVALSVSQYSWAIIRDQIFL